MVFSHPPRNTNFSTSPVAPGVLGSTGSRAESEGTAFPRNLPHSGCPVKFSVCAEALTHSHLGEGIVTPKLPLGKLPFNKVQ